MPKNPFDEDDDNEDDEYSSKKNSSGNSSDFNRSPRPQQTRKSYSTTSLGAATVSTKKSSMIMVPERSVAKRVSSVNPFEDDAGDTTRSVNSSASAVSSVFRPIPTRGAPAYGSSKRTSSVNPFSDDNDGENSDFGSRRSDIYDGKTPKKISKGGRHDLHIDRKVGDYGSAKAQPSVNFSAASNYDNHDSEKDEKLGNINQFPETSGIDGTSKITEFVNKSIHDLLEAADAAYTKRSCRHSRDRSEFKNRQKRCKARKEELNQLQFESRSILAEVMSKFGSRGGSPMRNRARSKDHLQSWEKALKVCIHFPDSEVNVTDLIQKLSDGPKDDKLLDSLNFAMNACDVLVESTAKAVNDATQDAIDAENAFRFKLEAQSKFAILALKDAERLEAQFYTKGRIAVEIGQDLEQAEAKRRQCENAAILIRRWWMIENLSEQEEHAGCQLLVDDEISGIIPPSSCLLDPLFTDPDSSLEAARTLRALRGVAKSATGGGADSELLRFERTSNLIQRLSDALECRLLFSFANTYNNGGQYDFSNTFRRPNKLNWMLLREIAEALYYFDNGRNLHKRYVQLVVMSKFPDLFQRETYDKTNLDIGETRDHLSSLFNRVYQVCSDEFSLIGHVFSFKAKTGPNQDVPVQVARSLLQRIINDPICGVQSRIDELLENIDSKDTFDAGSKKLDTFVVIHEKAAGLFHLLREAAENNLVNRKASFQQSGLESSRNSIAGLVQFLTSQENASTNGHRRGYLNLELRHLHHGCCSALEEYGIKLSLTSSTTAKRRGYFAEFVAPVMRLDTESSFSSESLDLYEFLLNSPLNPVAWRKPIVNAADSLARVRLMFGGSGGDGGDHRDSTARAISAIYSQVCIFLGKSLLEPCLELLQDSLNEYPPENKPQLPFDSKQLSQSLGIDRQFWSCLGRIYSAIKAFDDEVWGKGRGSARVLDSLEEIGSTTILTVAKERRLRFFQDVEQRGEAAVLRALDTISSHVRWILITGGESMFANGEKRPASSEQGPYALPEGSALSSPISPAAESLSAALKFHFDAVKGGLPNTHSVDSFWTALSMRIYDILCARLLQYYYVSTIGGVILARDVECIRSACTLAGKEHTHWDTLMEILVLYMTGPEKLQSILEGEGSKPGRKSGCRAGLFGRAGRNQCLVFLSRRQDYLVKTSVGNERSQWATKLLSELGVDDPTEGGKEVNIAAYSAAERIANSLN